MGHENKRLFIRADMNSTIATGHIMRCLSVADAAAKRGIKTVFIMADTEAVELLNSRGYDYIVLDSKWDNLETEIYLMEKLIKELEIEKLLIDHYYVTEAYMKAMTSMTYTIYMDDLGSFHYSVNAIICYASYWKKFKYEENITNVKLILGCDYVPLRTEFENLPRRQISSEVKKLLVLSGGSDGFHIIRNILEKIPRTDYASIDVICGRYNEDLETLRTRYQDDPVVTVYPTVSNLIDFMKKTDVAITAGGSTLYELCAVGTPSITYSFADNQLDNVRQFAEDDLMVYAGDVRYDDIYENIIGMLHRYRSMEKRKELSMRMQELVDGLGAQRIVERLFSTI